MMVGFMQSTYTAAAALRRAGIEVMETVIRPTKGFASTIMDVKQLGAGQRQISRRDRSARGEESDF